MNFFSQENSCANCREIIILLEQLTDRWYTMNELEYPPTVIKN
jgi:hypothetical protein